MGILASGGKKSPMGSMGKALAQVLQEEFSGKLL